MMVVILGGLAGVLVGCVFAYIVGLRMGKRIGTQAARVAQLPYHRRERRP